MIRRLVVLALLGLPASGWSAVAVTRDAVSAAGVDAAHGTTRITATLGGYPFARMTAPASVLFQGFWFPRPTPVAVPGDLPGLVHAFRLHPNYPNPFAARTAIRFVVPGRSGEQVRTRLDIFDVQGRRVTTLVDAELPPGVHESGWLGRDAAGRVVASGIYFGRLRCGERTATTVLVLLEP